MDSLNFFKGYGKVDAAENRKLRRKFGTILALIAITGVVFIALIAGVGIFVPANKRSGDSSSSVQYPVPKSTSINELCSVTRYPDSCFASLSSATANSSAVTADPLALFQISLSVASRSISKLSSFLSTLDIPASDKRTQAAVLDCKELLEDAIVRLKDSSAIVTESKAGEKILSDSKINDLKTWLSSTITNQETCLDGFEGTTRGYREKLKAAMTNSTRFTSNSLAIVTGILGIKENLHVPINRKLLSAMEQKRALLTGKSAIYMTVTKNGLGKLKGIRQAANTVPSSKRLVLIHVNRGEMLP